jgi:hypothetical protein
MTLLVLQLGLPNKDASFQSIRWRLFSTRLIALDRNSAKLKRPEFSKEGTLLEIQATPSEIHGTK